MVSVNLLLSSNATAQDSKALLVLGGQCLLGVLTSPIARQAADLQLIGRAYEPTEPESYLSWGNHMTKLMAIA